MVDDKVILNALLSEDTQRVWTNLDRIALYLDFVEHAYPGHQQTKPSVSAQLTTRE
jgi:hypothetical protein